MKTKIYEIDPIAIKDKNDLLKAAEILEKIGIYIFSSEEDKKNCEKNWNDITNNFLIKDSYNNWRIQSHYLSQGITIENLEEQVNYFLNKYPNLLNEIEKINKFEEEILKTEKNFNIQIKEKHF